jgi:hypothetical protein
MYISSRVPESEGRDTSATPRWPTRVSRDAVGTCNLQAQLPRAIVPEQKAFATLARITVRREVVTLKSRN